MILANEEQIQARLKEIASQINTEYKEITLLGILMGSLNTMMDLCKYITIPCKLEIIKASSYGDEMVSGKVKLSYCSLDYKKIYNNVLLIDDICDTGKTLGIVRNYLVDNYKIKNLKTMVLLDKPSRRKKPVSLDYIGFEIDNYFVYGYGLDDKGYERNKTCIYVKEGVK